MPTYDYPVSSKQQARTVTEPRFEPKLFGNEHELYVNFDAVRDTQFQSNVFFPLGIDTDTNRLEEPTDDYIKIICSGHLGCGKTTELKRLHSELHDPERYFSIFLSIEEETEYGSFQPEDLFVWILLKLVEAIEENQIPTGRTDFDSLAHQLLSSESIEKETGHKLSGELSAETGGGFDFLGLFKLKTEAKAVLASENATSKKIREEVRRNPLAIIRKINAALLDMRAAVRKVGKGGDVLFIIDGSEKLRFDVYEHLFIQNANLLLSLNLNMLIAVPINAYYKIEAVPSQNFSHSLIIPMIKLTSPESPANRLFKEVIERRIQANLFFEPGVLNECVRYSGGCIRQLLRIVNAVVYKSLGKRAPLAIAQAAIRAEGNALNQVITSKHLEALNRGLANLRASDPEVREMLLQLVLLKYNGHFELNPLLDGIVTLPPTSVI